MNVIEIMGYSVLIVVGVGMIYRGLCSLATSAAQQKEEGSRTLRIVAIERQNTIHHLRRELVELTSSFTALQDLAVWMTGCGYDFEEHPYYLKAQHLITQGIAIDDGVLEGAVAGKDKYHKEATFTLNEARCAMMAIVPCPVCMQPTVIGFSIKGDDCKIVEPRYCPRCGWKDEAIEGSDVEENKQATTKTGWGQD